MVELLVGEPLFPGIDENELLEFFIVTVGHPTKEMIKKSTKLSQFYDKDMNLIRSPKSCIPEG